MRHDTGGWKHVYRNGPITIPILQETDAHRRLPDAYQNHIVASVRTLVHGMIESSGYAGYASWQACVVVLARAVVAVVILNRSYSCIGLHVSIGEVQRQHVNLARGFSWRCRLPFAFVALDTSIVRVHDAGWYQFESVRLRYDG